MNDPALALRERTPAHVGVRSAAYTLLMVFVVGITGVGIASLVAAGLWFIALALLLVLPGFVLLHRLPHYAVVVWLLVAPYLLLTSGIARYGYWLAHRALPIAVLVALIATRSLGLNRRPSVQLGVPELLMVGYVAATLLSIGHDASGAAESVIFLYDRVIVPMCLYLAVRLIQPTEELLRGLVPVAAITVVAQATIGIISWVAPAALPSDWLGREGTRTIGSLGSPSVFGVTILGAGVFLLHAASIEERRSTRFVLRTLFAVGVVMAVVTFTRGVWLAAAVVVIAAAIVHPRAVGRMALSTSVVVILLMASGGASGQVTRIQERFANEQTALDRLPVALASLRMFEARPITGWGYGNFDEFDFEFQAEVAGFVPEKDHASHNLYLTLLAEQGLVGLVLYVGPAVWLLGRSVRNFQRLPRNGLASRKLVVLLWAMLLGHVIVNSFSNMRVVFGLGQWWLTLGLIASIVYMPAAPVADLPMGARARAFRGASD